MRRKRLFVLAIVALLPGAAPASEWGTIVPGTSTKESVRAQYGQPTRAEAQKIEGYDAAQWVYEGVQAPAGIQRMMIDFGLLTAAGFKENVVRSFRLDPRPNIFQRPGILSGWGLPTRIGRDGELEIFLYEAGLLVYFDKAGWNVQAMIFTPPQPVFATPPEPAPAPQR